MKQPTNWKLKVTEMGIVHYIPIKRIVCMVCELNCCNIYYYNRQKELVSITGTRPMEHYLERCHGMLDRLCRKASANLKYVAGIRKDLILFDPQDAALPAIHIPEEKITAVKDLLDSRFTG